MATLVKTQEVKAALQRIIHERNHFQKELAIAKEAINELQFQIIEFNRLLANAHKQLYIHDPKRLSRSILPKTWIGTWQSSPQEYPALTSVEETWRNGHLQTALNQMPGMLDREDFGNHHRINARLLYSAMISSSGANLPIALHYAEEALQLASTYRLHELAG